MNCENFKELINHLVEGELDSRAANDVNLHIFSCQNCEAEFDSLSNEKEIYSKFLFEIEPPKDLSARFQQKLKSAEQLGIVSAGNRLSLFNRFENLFTFVFFKPALAAAIALLALGFGFFILKAPIKTNDEILVSKSPTPAVLPTFVSENKELVPLKPNVISPKGSKNEVETIASKKPLVEKTKRLAISSNSLNIEKKFSPKKAAKKLFESPGGNSQVAAEFKQIRAFETETAKQIEKVEMLLRSFRNVRYEEGVKEYDIGYEKQQAGKLLAKNIELRQQSENYGSMFTRELLSRVEPYLLDISNLENNPSEEEILEIKQRVKNQNIIVSLQGF
jgi:hypothetical protein